MYSYNQSSECSKINIFFNIKQQKVVKTILMREESTKGDKKKVLTRKKAPFG